MRVECFISYSRKDAEIAKQIVSLLENEGIFPWWDEKISPASENFINEIRDKIKNCQCFLVIWTDNSVKADYVIGEVHFIHEQEKRCNYEKMVSISVNNPSIPPPFNIIQALPINWTANKILDKEEKKKILDAVKSKIGIIGSNEHIIHPRTLGEAWEFGDLAIESPVPGTNILSSFRPFGKGGTFLTMRFETTSGWVDARIPSAHQRNRLFRKDSDSSYKEGEKEYLKIKNDVLFIKDPIRPYSIQIGGIRSERPNANPGTIESDIKKLELNTLPTQLPWLSLTLAEILTDQDTLQELSSIVEDQIITTENKISNSKNTKSKKQNTGRLSELKERREKLAKVKEAIARNPFSPLEIQMASCRFCDFNFKRKRHRDSNNGATLIANDFPFGPNFHYVAILDEPIHSWENVEYHHLLKLNELTHRYVSLENNRFGAAGIEYGFNSTVRHLVLGRKTHSSAGASIPHIHKQIWGMAPNTTNLADQLITVSDAYSNINIDYQECYVDALRDADYVIWEDKNAVLYIPFGQISTHELQVMMCRPFGSYIDFTDEEIKSLTLAEFLVFKIYKELGITSFNSIFISKLLNDKRAPKFRVVQTFVTREVDLAVSELSTLYVVDQHPYESRRQVKKIFEGIRSTPEIKQVFQEHNELNVPKMEVIDFVNARPKSK
jgi:hypothetical protein